MATKDTKLEEKDEYVVQGTILADNFKFRTTGKDVANAGGDAWVEEMKDRIKVDPEDDDILLVNDGMQVDNNGDVTIGRDLFVEDEVVIDNLQKIVDTDGEPIIPDPTGHVGEVLYHTTTGYGWKQADSGWTEITLTKSTIEGLGNISSGKLFYDSSRKLWIFAFMRLAVSSNTALDNDMFEFDTPSSIHSSWNETFIVRSGNAVNSSGWATVKLDIVADGTSKIHYTDATSNGSSSPFSFIVYDK